MYKREHVPLDPSLRCSDAVEFETELRRRVVGQEEAVLKTTEAIQKFMAGLNDPERPVANILLLGPTGTGKTRLVEAVCEIMFGDPKGMVRLDCAEFQQSHEVAKLIGSPPGYIGHSSSGTQVTQEKLDKTHTNECKLSVLLLDEIEKAHENFWELLLGILDKARLTDSTSKVIDFTHTLIFMTSNLGAREMATAMDGGIGFTSSEEVDDSRLAKISSDAAVRKFSPEFMNRLDCVITFQHLDEDALKIVLEIETGHIQKRILSSSRQSKFVLSITDPVKSFLIKEGTSKRYGARHLKRTLDRYIVTPISNFILTSQLGMGDVVEVVLDNGQLRFWKIPADIIAESTESRWRDFKRASDEDVLES